MQANRGRDTGPEMALRRAVHALGLRYRVDYPPLAQFRRRRADLVFTRARLAVFVDGCFWHGCPEHHSVAKANADYWANKVAQNRARDLETDQLLANAGWRTMRFWEHQNMTEAAEDVATAVRGPSAN
ncbi:very short patch repair endonuclease [Angustibacter sp. McL0619]|uniref:very short patch repair endonuclease n=1 Tax=Angustibacter sp. McL0619 TaxID=3415676 RepID=UPI003CEDCD4D